MNIVLRNHLEATEKSASEIEAQLKRDHQGAMLCYEVQDLIRSVVQLFADISKDVDRWQSEISATDDNTTLVSTSDWLDLYRKLEGICAKAAGLIGQIELEQYQVEGKGKFLAVWRELRGITIFSEQQIATAAQQVRSSRMRSLGEIRDALSNSSL